MYYDFLVQLYYVNMHDADYACRRVDVHDKSVLHDPAPLRARPGLELDEESRTRLGDRTGGGGQSRRSTTLTGMSGLG